LPTPNYLGLKALLLLLNLVLSDGFTSYLWLYFLPLVHQLYNIDALA
jgi:hypothetical protein